MIVDRRYVRNVCLSIIHILSLQLPMNVNFVKLIYLVRESKLAEVRDLRTQVTTRQTELMDFILLLKARKRELKKNLTV
jgi:hypothetical protein